MTSEILSYLIAVADYQNISRAARTVHISQPALSQYIRDAEEELGVSLFSRLSHGVQLTDCGRIFISNARLMLNTEAQMLSDIAHLKESSISLLELFLEEKIKNHISENWLGQYRAKFPNDTLDIHTGSTRDGIAALLQGLCEIAVFYVNDDFLPDLNYYIMEEHEYLLAVPNTHPCRSLLSQNINAVRDLEKETFILNSTRSEFRSFQKTIMERYHLYPENILVVDHLTTVCSMLNQGYGIGFLPTSMPAQVSVNYTCFSLPKPFMYQIVLAHRKGAELSVPARELWELVTG